MRIQESGGRSQNNTTVPARAYSDSCLLTPVSFPPNAPRPVSAGRGIQLRTERRDDDYNCNHPGFRDRLHDNHHRSAKATVRTQEGMMFVPSTLLNTTPNRHGVQG